MRKEMKRDSSRSCVLTELNREMCVAVEEGGVCVSELHYYTYYSFAILNTANTHNFYFNKCEM